MPRWQWGMPVNVQPYFSKASSAVWRWNFRFLYFHPVVNSWIAEDSFTFLLYIQEYGGTWKSTLLLVFTYCPGNQSILFLNSGTHWTWFAVTPWAVPLHTCITSRSMGEPDTTPFSYLWSPPPLQAIFTFSELRHPSDLIYRDSLSSSVTNFNIVQ